MSDDARDRSVSDPRLAEEAALSARLKNLEQRLEHERPSRPSSPANGRPATDTSAMARGLRLSSELVAGVIVGGVIGWGLDHLFGISPWGMIVFLLLGFAAGVLNVMRSAGVVAERDWNGKR
jgi:ATP synthase protein I